jgi:hypothetical protein
MEVVMQERSEMWCATSVVCVGTSVIDASVLQPMLIVGRPIGIRLPAIVVVVVVLVMNKVKHHSIMVVMDAMVTS